MTAAGATLIIPPGNLTPAKAQRKAIAPSVFNVMDYGARGDGQHSDWAAFQGAINDAQGSIASKYSTPAVIVPPLVYLLDHPLDLQRVILVPIGRPHLVGNGNDGLRYRPPSLATELRGFTFSRFNRALTIDFDSPHTASARFVIDQCDCWEDCGLFIDTVNYTQGRSAILDIRGCTCAARSCARLFCDVVNISGGQIFATGQPGQSVMVYADALLNVRGTMLIPTGNVGQSVWFGLINSDLVRGANFEGLRGSGEAAGGGMPLAEYVGQGNNDFGACDSGGYGITIRDSYVNGLGANAGRKSPLILTGCPNTVIMENLTGGCALDGIVCSSPSFKPLSRPGAFSIRIDQPTRRLQMLMNPPGAIPVSDALSPYLEKL